MREVAVVIWQPPRAITGSSTIAQARSLSVGARFCAHHRGILRMQMHAHLARGDRQRRDRFANDADDLRRDRS